MSDQYTCNVTNIAGSSAHLLMALVVCVDVLVREIPPLIAKGRISVALVVACDFAINMLTANDASGKDSGRFVIGVVPSSMSVVSYFGENFLHICVDHLKSSKLEAKAAVPKHFIKALRWSRWVSVLCAAGLLVALEVTPTNAVMVWCHAGLSHM